MDSSWRKTLIYILTCKIKKGKEILKNKNKKEIRKHWKIKTLRKKIYLKYLDKYSIQSLLSEINKHINLRSL